jgi:hypothetical protein
MAYSSAASFSRTRAAGKPRGENAGHIRGLDDAENNASAFAATQSLHPSDASSSSSYGGFHPSGAPVSSRFDFAPHAGDNEHHGHFRESTLPLSQQSKTYSNSTLQGLAPYKIRDLFQSQAARTMVTRKEVLAATNKELYVPRTAKLLKAEDFTEFNAAAAAYAATMANTTANSRAKAAARAASLAAGTTGGAAGAGGGAAATVAAATASALASSAGLSASGAALQLPIIPDTIDAFELGKAAATEAYLQDIWNENRQKEASDERLRKHIKQLVHDWSSKLARFEEEVQRRQEDSYYAKWRRQEKGNPLAKSMGSLGAEEKTNTDSGSSTSRQQAMLRAHRAFAFREDPAEHHRREAFSLVQTGKTEHPDNWPTGTDSAVPEPKVKGAGGLTAKELAKKRRAALDHQMAHSICASTLAAPPQPSPLKQILSAAEQHYASLNGGVNPLTGAPQPHFLASNPRERTHLSFSAFRPTTTPAVRQDLAAKRNENGGNEFDAHADETPRPATAGHAAAGTKLPHLHGLLHPPTGLSVRQTRPPPFHGVPGHGHPLHSVPDAPHVFSSLPIARAAGVTDVRCQPAAVHVRKREELLEVERIKMRLAREEINVPRGTLERALVPPEVRFSADAAASDLPTPFFGLPMNPFEGQAKKKKGKGKGKKK